MASRDFGISGEKVIIRDKKLDDAGNDYAWSRDAELSRLDAAYPLNITLERFISEYKAELSFPAMNRRRFAIDTPDGKHIGNCSYYNIDMKRKETEIGIMIGDPDYWGKGYGADAIKALVDYLFEFTKFKRLYLKTLDWNFRAQRCFAKCGFREYKRLPRDGYTFVLMELSREQWLDRKTKQEQNEANSPVIG